LREYGVAAPTFHRWKRKYGGLELSQLHRRRELARVSNELMTIVAAPALDVRIRKEVSS
jgi:hypothetical protein